MHLTGTWFVVLMHPIFKENDYLHTSFHANELDLYGERFDLGLLIEFPVLEYRMIVFHTRFLDSVQTFVRNNILYEIT